MAQAAVVKEYSFQWEGTDRKGARVKGVTQGPNENAVRMNLRRQGVNPIRVRRKSIGSTAAASTTLPAMIAQVSPTPA